MGEREAIERLPQLRRSQRSREVGGDLHRARSGVDLERDARAAARLELRGLADLPARGEVVPAAVNGDRRAVPGPVQRDANRHAFARAELCDDALRYLR